MLFSCISCCQLMIGFLAVAVLCTDHFFQCHLL